MKIITAFVLSALCATSLSAFAWGRHGHHLIAETGGYLAAKENEAGALKSKTYDLGYYANVPDLIWKRPATYDTEKVQHFMDMEIYDRELVKKPEVKEPLALSRKDFEAQFPELKTDAGRSFWRIRELNDELTQIAEQLRTMEEQKGKSRQDVQGKWLVTAGVMAHYIGDLGMPLHVSENYDGQLTGQKGLHSYFEDTCVDEVFPELQVKVKTQAERQWPAYKKKSADKSVLALLQELTESSRKEVRTMLAIDKENKRDNVKRTCRRFEPMLVRRMAATSLVLAELYRRQLGWKWDNERFYFFVGEPEYIKPGPAPAVKM